MTTNHTPNQQGEIIGRYYDKPIFAWFTDDTGQKYNFDRAGRLDRNERPVPVQLQPNEVMIAPALIYRKAEPAAPAKALPVKITHGACLCGQAVNKVENLAQSGVIYQYPQSTMSRSAIFRCNGCGQPIAQRWKSAGQVTEVSND